MNKFMGLALAPVILMSPLVLPAGHAASAPSRLVQSLRKTLRPSSRQGSTFSPYNFPQATRGDRFARRGLDLRVGIKGWRHFGKVIKRVAQEQKIDPYVLGAYVWIESGFDPNQDYSDNGKRALGLGSVQATDHPQRDPDELREPYVNLTLTAKEFRHKWRPQDMAGTVMDVWYPAWRKRVANGERIPVVHAPDVYVQALANRYYALQDIDRHMRMR